MEHQRKSSSLKLSILVAIVGLLMSYLVGFDGAKFWGMPVALLCALLAFLINWLAFIPANVRKTERFYDLVGTMTYVSVIVLACLLSLPLDWRAVLVASMVVVWSTRLGLFLIRRIQQDGKDDRFDEIKQSPSRFFLAWTLQGLWVVLTLLCVMVVITTQAVQPIGGIGVVGVVLWGLGFAIEVIADAQKRAFKKRPENSGEFIQSGLWSISQHPNYFGEITLWFGIAMIALPVLDGWQYLALTAPAFVYLLLTRISGIPMLDKKAELRWGDNPSYQQYKKNTPVLIPWVR